MPPKMTRKQALEWAKSLPADDDDQTVHVFKVKKTDPEWAWLFGKSAAPDGDDDATDDDADDDEGDDKPEPKPKPRNKFFGGS